MVVAGEDAEQEPPSTESSIKCICAYLFIQYIVTAIAYAGTSSRCRPRSRHLVAGEAREPSRTALDGSSVFVRRWNQRCIKLCYIASSVLEEYK